MISLGITDILSKTGFGASFLTNSFLIYLTIFHVRKIHGTYKQMIVYFAISGILLTGLEPIARPFCHNFNGSLIYFSVGTLDLPQFTVQLILSIWAGFYLQTISFISIQFYYRYLCFFDVKKAKSFGGLKSVLWIGYPLIIGASYSTFIFLFSMPDTYSDDYMRSEIFEVYGLEITERPRFDVVFYDAEGNIRIRSLCFTVSSISMITVHYIVILYCGIRMHVNMKRELKKFSAPQRKLQRQFFHALIAQCSGPTLFLVLRAAPVLLTPIISPIVDISVSWRTGWFYSIVGLYPPFDSIAYMVIVTEYKKVIRS
ncbi:hypothetical protein CAEBREN_22621 [Caenorhabditis brenneri]|uniref:Uncharacterized protein n=1 Tax=Caenorhabditis brenneri TaxID=135651 RepID=G0PHB0_CAEBE|nr:hypothetical protein CAEBREN_22621 [Caenorhabditis brenneri]